MSSGIGPRSSSGSQQEDPYSILGIEPGSNFELVQKAKAKRLLEVGSDPKARARIEASYDSVLMNSLKERQLGKASNAAINASKKEEQVSSSSLGKSTNALLTRFNSSSSSKKENSFPRIFPEFSLPESSGLVPRLILGFLAFFLLIFSPEQSIDLILAISTIGLFLSQVRRGRRPLPSIGWSVVSLSLGLIIGGGFIEMSQNLHLNIPLTPDQIEAVPAILVLWAGSLFIA